MSTTKGTIFMTLLAALPPVAVLSVYLFESNLVASLSLPVKTAGCLAYILLIYNTAFRYFTDPLRYFPTPPGESFLFGQTLNHMSAPPGTLELQWLKQTPNNGVIAFRGLFHRSSWLAVTTPEAAMEVLNANPYDWQKPAFSRLILDKILGNGLVVAEASEHKLQRKNVMPAFLGNNIKNLVPLFWTKSIALTDLVSREAVLNNDRVEISHLISRATLDIIGIAGLGKDFGTTTNADHELAVQYSRLADPKDKHFKRYILALVFLPTWLVSVIPMQSRVKVESVISEVRRITAELLSEKRQVLSEKTAEQKDILAILMRSGKFSTGELTDQLLTFLAAGHETTASALTWTIYLLSKHPYVQGRLRQSCQAAFGSIGSGSEMTAERIDSVDFLEAVCNECLRLFPPVPSTIREACRQTKILDHVIPKGSHVLISLWALNRSPALWGSDADDFKPDRWMGTGGRRGGAASPYAFGTFLHGPRGCIGQSFARYELKCLLAALLLRFSFSLRDPEYVAVPEGEITIRPKDGMEVVVVPVEV